MKAEGNTGNRLFPSEMPGTRKSGDASAILREQQLESDLEVLWMDGPAIVNEEQPRTKSLRILLTKS